LAKLGLVFWDSSVIDLNHYKELVVALSNKYKVEVEVSMKLEDGSTKRLLSKKPGKLIKHLAQATPYQNKLLQNWDILSQDNHHFDSACNIFKVGAVNHSVGAVFLHLHDGGLCRVFRGEFKGAVFNILVKTYKAFSPSHPLSK
jgi:hypothetical protein